MDLKKSDENSPPAPKKRVETIAVRLSRLVRGAFSEAAIGNEGKARGLWNTALKNGYLPTPKKAKGFEIMIQKGLRETRR